MKNLYRRNKISQLLNEPLSNGGNKIIEDILSEMKDLTVIYDNGEYVYHDIK